MSTRIVGFLRRLSPHFKEYELAALERLAGSRVGHSWFYASLDECIGSLEPWMPLYYLPFGESDGLSVGFHLRPTDVEAGRLAVMTALDESTFVERAGSIEPFVYDSLVGIEGRVQQGKPKEVLESSLAVASEVFGPTFYVAGRHGRITEDNRAGIVARRYGGSVKYLLDTALLAEDETERHRLLGEAAALDRRAFSVHGALADLYEETAERRPLAVSAADALRSLHHTAYTATVDDVYRQARLVLADHPDVFDEDLRKDVETAGERDRFEWMAGEYERGRYEFSAKLLLDMCHDRRDYNSVLPVIKKHYEKLGWQWALELCHLRDGRSSQASRQAD